MAEEKQGGLLFGLIIRGEIEPELVSGLKVPCVRHQWNPIAHLLADRYGHVELSSSHALASRDGMTCKAAGYHPGSGVQYQARQIRSIQFGHVSSIGIEGRTQAKTEIGGVSNEGVGVQ